MTALGVCTHGDGLLSVVAPIGLAAAAGTALVIDLDPGGPSYGGEATLARLVEDGPRRDDLRPSGPGVAVLANGGIEADDAGEVIRALIGRWPAVVLRCIRNTGLPAPPVPVYPLLPGSMAPTPREFCVYQRTGFAADQVGEGIVLPRPAPSTIRALLHGTLPPRSRWIRAWRRVWEYRWV